MPVKRRPGDPRLGIEMATLVSGLPIAAWAGLIFSDVILYGRSCRTYVTSRFRPAATAEEGNNVLTINPDHPMRADHLRDKPLA